MNVLFGWELGGGQGHIQRLSALAQELQKHHGIQPVFALKSYHLENRNLRGKIIASPQLPIPYRYDSYTYPDILESFGFGNENFLQSHLEMWRNLIDSVRPRLVIADHAPGLVLAAYNRVPVIVIGEGFAVPPAVDEFPTLRFPAPPESFQRQERVRKTVHKLLKETKPLGQLLGGNESLIFTIPALDPYAYLRDSEKYVGLHFAPVPEKLYSSSGNVWAYLSDRYPYRELILESFQTSCQFEPLAKALSGKSLAVHHASLTTATACLLAGIPQIVFPRHLEEYLNALTLSQMGVAILIEQPTWELLVDARSQSQSMAQISQEKANGLSVWNRSYLDTFMNMCSTFLR